MATLTPSRPGHEHDVPHLVDDAAARHALRHRLDDVVRAFDDLVSRIHHAGWRCRPPSATAAPGRSRGRPAATAARGSRAHGLLRRRPAPVRRPPPPTPASGVHVPAGRARAPRRSRPTRRRGRAPRPSRGATSKAQGRRRVDEHERGEEREPDRRAQPRRRGPPAGAPACAGTRARRVSQRTSAPSVAAELLEQLRHRFPGLVLRRRGGNRFNRLGHGSHGHFHALAPRCAGESIAHVDPARPGARPCPR